MKQDMPEWSRRRRFSSSVQQKKRKLSATSASEIHIFSPFRTHSSPSRRAVERYLRNCKAAVIYEGTRDIHTLMQADWALGLKGERPARKTLPPYHTAGERETVGAD